MTVLTPAVSIFSHKSSSINSLFLARSSPLIGCLISSAVDLPNILSAKLTITLPPSIISVSGIESFGLAPQYVFVIAISCATSQSLLVKYPEFAVFKAVSASPFLAPCVELKYSKAVRPSLKFAVIGVSMISPEGFAINPLIPANCFICAAEPLAPESAIMKTEFVSIRPFL